MRSGTRKPIEPPGNWRSQTGYSKFRKGERGLPGAVKALYKKGMEMARRREFADK